MSWIKINEELYSNSISPHILFLQDGTWLVKKTNYDTDLELPIEDVLNNPIGTQEILFADGSETNPSIAFQNASSTGIFRDSNENLSFTVNGKNRFLIEPTGQIKSVYESTVGTDYNDLLHNGYFCRAWVNFDGTGTFSPNPSSSKIRASGNVSSVLKNGAGEYTTNLLTPMPDENYSILLGSQRTINVTDAGFVGSYSQSINSFRINTRNTAGTSIDHDSIQAGVFR
jgi:hypothetical protein